MADPVYNPVFVRALYAYTSLSLSELSFRAGQVIEIIERSESGWWDAMINGERGWVPSNYLSPVREAAEEEEGIGSQAGGNGGSIGN